MKAKDRKSSFRYLNKLIDQYSNTYHHSIGTKPINDDCSALTEKVETNAKAHKFKAGDKLRIIRYNNIFGKGYTENW